MHGNILVCCSRMRPPAQQWLPQAEPLCGVHCRRQDASPHRDRQDHVSAQVERGLYRAGH